MPTKSVTWRRIRVSNEEVGQTWKIELDDYESTHKGPAEAKGALTTLLYMVLHCGRSPERLREGTQSSRDTEFEKRLIGAGSRQRIWQECQLAAQDGGRVEVLIDGVRVSTSIEETRRQPGEGSAWEAQVPAIRPNLSPGYMLLNGLGGGRRLHRAGLLRFYVGLEDPGEAEALWEPLSAYLFKQDFAWQMKCLSRAEEFPRHDGLVVYADSHMLEGKLDKLSQIASRELGDKTVHLSEVSSPWVLKISERASVAFEPEDPRPEYSSLSFGVHRSSIAADALISSVRHGLEPEENIRQHLTHANVDNARPWRNLSSPLLDKLMS